jgi:hypothetical protein
MGMKDARHLIKEIIQVLDFHREKYFVLPPDESSNATAWLERTFPTATWGRILWSLIPGSNCRTWKDKWKDLPQVFVELCDAHNLQNPEVIIAWTNSLKPALRMSLDVVQRHAIPIFEMDFDTWVICESPGWCIEIYHEGEICFGKADQPNNGFAR